MFAVKTSNRPHLDNMINGKRQYIIDCYEKSREERDHNCMDFYAAWLFCSMGYFDKAERLLFLGRDAEDAGLRSFFLGHIRLIQGKTGEAIQAYIESTEGSNFSGERKQNNVQEIVSRFSDGDRFGVFRAFYDQLPVLFDCFLLYLIPNKSEFQSFMFVFARAMDFFSLRTISDEFISEEKRINSNCAWPFIYAGHRFWLQGNKEACAESYETAKHLCQIYNIVPFHFDCGVLVWKRNADVQDGIFKIKSEYFSLNQEILHYFCENISPSIVISLGCDGNYLKYLGLILCSLVSNFNGSNVVVVHLYVVNASATQIQFLHNTKELFNKSAKIGFSFSYSKPIHQDRAFYTCLRFFLCQNLMYKYRAAVMPMDIDTILMPKFFEMIDVFKEKTIGLTLNGFENDNKTQIGGRPWTIAAGMSLFGKNDISLIFIDYLLSYIKVSFDTKNITNWTIDQCGLCNAFDSIKFLLEPKAIFNFSGKEDLVKYLNSESRSKVTEYPTPSTDAEYESFLAFIKCRLDKLELS